MTGTFAAELAQSGVLLQANPLNNLGNQILRYIVGGINDAVTMGFALVVAGIVFFAGTKIADRIADRVAESETASYLPSPEVATELTKGVVMFIAAVVAVSIAGIDPDLLGNVLLVTVLPIGLAAAIAVGIALGYGSQDWVQERVEEWT